MGSLRHKMRRFLDERVRSLTVATGYELRRIRRARVPDGYPALADLQTSLAHIPGMISSDRCLTHYLMAYAQSVRGDIVEVGSWQGRNTCYLAAACRDSGNGVVHAIDHFRGNPGKQEFYTVGRDDLSDLEHRFRMNVDQVGLSPWVRLHATDVAEVQLEEPLRMLFIDGEHTYEAVSHDLTRLAPLVVPGGLVIFDDYSPEFGGVVEAVHEWAGEHSVDTPIQLENSLVAKIPG